MDFFAKSIKKLIKSCDCDGECNVKRFKQNFKNWTSGDNYIDKYIQDSQLSDHSDYTCQAIEWIPYNRLYDIKYISEDKFCKVYRAKWTDGYIDTWDNEHQDWKRKGQNMFVILKSLNSPADVESEFINEFCKTHEFYGITQDLVAKNYMVVLDDECEKCKYVCCKMHFLKNFQNWTSGNEDVDKFIQDIQLSMHGNHYGIFGKAIEWIPYNKFYDIEYITKDVYRAKWIDGYIIEWDYKHQNWKREGQNIFIILKSLNNPADVALEFRDGVKINHRFYGITQDPETKNYIKVLSDICEKCKYVCSTIHFQRNFKNWTSGNEDVDKFIKDSQLSTHVSNYEVFERAIEWIPYNRFYNIEYITKNVYRAKWIDGYMNKWDYAHQNWKREGQNIFVILKSLNNPADIALEFRDGVHEFYGITHDSKTKNYMKVLNDICEKCKYACNIIHFQHNFENWTSGNEYIDIFIQDAQLSAHGNYEVFRKAIEWIPHDKFYDIEYITKDGFDKVYEAKWIDGYINEWDCVHQNWKRKDQNIFVILKSLNNPAEVALEFSRDVVKINHEFYGITQDSKTKNYMKVLNAICEKCKYMCSVIYFQHNFKNWTSAIEWIPYNKFYNIEYITKDVYRAKWIDGNIIEWDYKHQNWKREGQNIFVILKSLNNPADVILEFSIDEVEIDHEFYGITQDPKTKNYMKVLNDICENHDTFQQNFKNWTSGNEDVDKFIQDAQLSAHDNYDVFRKAIEWIPFNRFYDIEYITEDGSNKVVYRAKWIDGYINEWDYEYQNWKRKGQNMFVILKSLNNPADATLEFMDEIITVPHEVYGITQI
ncbi:unnamed protein product [Rhizophagus irregularis]|nr:unnamed protein product [Rhizophagus irregularis]